MKFGFLFDYAPGDETFKNIWKVTGFITLTK